MAVNNTYVDMLMGSILGAQNVKVVFVEEGLRVMHPDSSITVIARQGSVCSFNSFPYRSLTITDTTGQKYNFFKSSVYYTRGGGLTPGWQIQMIIDHMSPNPNHAAIQSGLNQKRNQDDITTIVIVFGIVFIALPVLLTVMYFVVTIFIL